MGSDKEEEILNAIKVDMECEEIPSSLKPENMKRRLEVMEEKNRNDKRKKMKKWSTILATAACMGILVTAGFHMKDLGREETIGADNAMMTEGIKDANSKIAFMEYTLRKKGIYDE